MAAVVLPTIQRMIDVLIARVLGSPGLQDLNTSSGDDIWKIVNALARRTRAVLVDFAGFAVNTIPSTATGLWLDHWADTFLDAGRIAATAWVGTITFTAGAGLSPPIPAGATLTFADGTEYETTAPIVPADWSGTPPTATAASDAITLGTDGNQANGTELTVNSPPAGVLSTAVIASTVTNARDAELDPELQLRISNQTKYRPASGNEAHYRAWAMEVAGVTDCAVYPRWDGDTTITVVPVGPPGSNRTLSVAVRNAVAAKILAERPMNVTATVESLAAWAAAETVAVEVRAEPGYEQDWTNGTDSIDVASTSADKKTVFLDADPTGTIEVGDRVIGYSGAGLVAEQRIVDVVTGAPTNSVHVTVAFSAALAGTTVLTPGGPLWQPVRDAIQDVFDVLGPSGSSTAGKPRFPPVESGELPPHLRLQDLYSAIGAIEGVESCLISDPASDVLNNRAAAATIMIILLDENVTITWG